MPSESGPAVAADAVDAERVESAEAVAPDERDEADGIGSETAADRDPIEWGPVRHDRLRSLVTGGSIGVTGVLLVAVVGVAAAMLSEAATGGISISTVGPAGVVAGVGLLVALGVTTLPYLYVWYSETEAGEWSLARLRDAAGTLRPGWTLGGLAAVLGTALALPENFLSAVWPLFWVVWALPAVAQSAGTTVRLAPAAATVERTYINRDHSRTDDLGSVVRTRRIDLPWTTVFLLAYRGNAWYRSTPWLFVPSEKADEVESALDAVLAESDGPDRASVPERLTLAALGSFSLVVGILMAIAGGEGAGGVALALLTAPFSLLFLALAARL
ncbi:MULTISPECIES: hypothetical protein [Halorubrum]|uniref:Uncharacterized protein n=1 Tax=Halorubrum hochstenium ATCC 700873 TaxID=1227481 RepID=M0FCJ3_9EURY|nr:MULTISPECIES: hypothetical protein [Halorubrum]ELZ57660.1 hypothetical protein C467_06387 [Halorubrum hochstenium ATCC 700873]